MTEAQLEKKCRKYAKDNGCRLYKWVSPGTAGVPDDFLCIPRKKFAGIGPLKFVDPQVIFVEFKAPGKKATKLQQYHLDELREMGFECHVIDNFERFKELI